MTVMISVCAYHKYGHCKYKNTCRKRHVDELCKENACVIDLCSKRHPRQCRYYQNFGRCKCGKFCSFSHDVMANTSIREEILAMKHRLSQLEELTFKQASDLKTMSENIDALKKENDKLRQDAENFNANVKNIIEKVVSQTTEAVIKQMTTHQTSVENQTNLLLNSMQEQITSIMNLNTSKTVSSPVNDDSIQCNVCDKHYGSKRKLAEHMRTNHRP